MIDSLMGFLTHPVVMGILGIAGLLLIFFFIKQFFKIALILILALLVGFSLYYGFMTPGSYKEKMKGAVEKTTNQSEALLKKGKEKIVQEGKRITKKLDQKKDDR